MFIRTETEQGRHPTNTLTYCALNSDKCGKKTLTSCSHVFAFVHCELVLSFTASVPEFERERFGRCHVNL